MDPTVLFRVQHNRRLVPTELVLHFCRVCSSVTLAVPSPRFYTRSLFFEVKRAEQELIRELKDLEKNNSIGSFTDVSGSKTVQLPSQVFATLWTRLAFPVRRSPRRWSRPTRCFIGSHVAQRNGEPGIRRNFWTQYRGCLIWFVGGSRFLERPRKSQIDFYVGAECAATDWAEMFFRATCHSRTYESFWGTRTTNL